MKVADVGSSNLSFYGPLLNEKQKKKVTKENEYFSLGKISFGQDFLIKSGVIVIKVFSVIFYLFPLFFLLCRYLQVNNIQKLENGTFSGLNVLEQL